MDEAFEIPQSAIRQGEPTPEADEFGCEYCGFVYDIDDSIRVGDELWCIGCFNAVKIPRQED